MAMLMSRRSAHHADRSRAFSGNPLVFEDKDGKGEEWNVTEDDHSSQRRQRGDHLSESLSRKRSRELKKEAELTNSLFGVPDFLEQFEDESLRKKRSSSDSDEEPAGVAKPAWEVGYQVSTRGRCLDVTFRITRTTMMNRTGWT